MRLCLSLSPPVPVPALRVEAARYNSISLTVYSSPSLTKEEITPLQRVLFSSLSVCCLFLYRLSLARSPPVSRSASHSEPDHSVTEPPTTCSSPHQHYTTNNTHIVSPTSSQPRHAKSTTASLFSAPIGCLPSSPCLSPASFSALIGGVEGVGGAVCVILVAV